MSRLTGALDIIRMLGEEARRRREYEKARDNQIAQMAREMHVDLGEGDRTVRVLGMMGPSGPLLITSVEVKPARAKARVRYADENGVEHLTEWGAMTVPAGSTFLYIEISPDAE